MNKKLLSFALAVTMFASSAVYAASLKDFVNNSSEVTGEFIDNGMFDYTKFRQSAGSQLSSQVTDTGAVKAEVVAEASASGANAFAVHPEAAPLYSSTGSFDFKVTLKMDNVKTAYEELLNITKVSVGGESSATYTQLMDSLVTGEFKVEITTPAELSFTTPAIGTNAEFTQGADLFEFVIYDETAKTVTFKVKDGTKVSDLAAANALDDISFTLNGVSATSKGVALPVTAKLSDTSYTIFKEAAENSEYAKINYASDEGAAYVCFRTGGGSSGGSSSTTAPKAYTVVDEKTTSVDVIRTNNQYTVDVDALSVPAKEGYTFDGWYLDKEFTKPASGTITITNDTYLYAKFTEQGSSTEPPKGFVSVGKDKNTIPVEEKDGKYYINADNVEVPAKDGFAFAGWYTNPYFSDAAEGEFEITEDTTLYPRYVSLKAPEQLISEEHVAYIVGYPDGEVKPNENMTREEVIAAFYRLLKPEFRATIETTNNDFADVSADRWSNTAISTMANGGFIVGDNGNFNPSKPITRAEFVTIANKFLAADAEPAVNYFTDISGHWAENAILLATGQFWISGYEDSTFRPDNNITRAEVMTIINKMLVRYGDVNATAITQWPDINKNDWFYSSVIEATNENKYERHADGWNETWINEAE